MKLCPAALRRRTNCLRAACVLFLIAAGCSGTTAPVDAPARRDDSARIKEITGRMLEAYRKARSYADNATYTEQAVYRGEGVERELPFYQMSLAFERPNRIRLKFEEAVDSSTGRIGVDVASNGTKLRASLQLAPGQILEVPAPAEIDAQNLFPDPALREVFGGRALSDVFPQLAMLLHKDEKTLVFADDSNPLLLDEAPLRGRSCYRISTSNPEGTRVLWIDRETYALVRMELPVEGHRRLHDPEHIFLKLAVRIDFEDPTFNARIDRNAFTMEVPAGAEAVDKLELQADNREKPAADESAAGSSTERDLPNDNAADRGE